MKKIVIFGCGISGATVARLYAEKNYQVDIYETRNHVGGNCYDYYDNHGILVHKYGPHIFHTSNESVYKFINRFCKLNGFINKVKVKVENKIVPLPINFKSIKQLFPREGDYIIKRLIKSYPNTSTITLNEMRKISDEKVQKLFQYIYNNVYANYSQKMWGIPIERLSKNIIDRVQVTLGYDESYFPKDKYQGLPKEGYTKFVENIINHKNINVILNKDVLSLNNGKTYIDGKFYAGKIFYCGSIDRLFDYKLGKLDYRSLNIVFESVRKKKYLPTAVVNYPMHPVMTRCCEYKQMTLQKSSRTTVSKEFPGKYSMTSKKYNTPFYPLNDKVNLDLYKTYVELKNKYRNLQLLGRMAQYKYFDMDDAILNALECIDINLTKKKKNYCKTGNY